MQLDGLSLAGPQGGAQMPGLCGSESLGPRAPGTERVVGRESCGFDLVAGPEGGVTMESRVVVDAQFQNPVAGLDAAIVLRSVDRGRRMGVGRFRRMCRCRAHVAHMRGSGRICATFQVIHTCSSPQT